MLFNLNERRLPIIGLLVIQSAYDSLLDSFNFEDGLETFTVFSDGKDSSFVHDDAKVFQDLSFTFSLVENPLVHLLRSQFSFLCNEQSNILRDVAIVISEIFHQGVLLESCLLDFVMIRYPALSFFHRRVVFLGLAST